VRQIQNSRPKKIKKKSLLNAVIMKKINRTVVMRMLSIKIKVKFNLLPSQRLPLKFKKVKTHSFYKIFVNRRLLFGIKRKILPQKKTTFTQLMLNMKRKIN
jgi:hypothetical protein